MIRVWENMFLAAALVVLPALLVRAAEPARPAERADDPVRVTIDAATRDAVEALVDEIARARLSGRVTAGQLLRDTTSFDELRKTLQQAEQVGGPRWVDDRTCQVQLQVSGTRVAATMRRVAGANQDSSPLRAAEVDLLTRDWNKRSFTATGQAVAERPVGDQAAGQQRPGAIGLGPGRVDGRNAWQNVSEADKEKAVAAAKSDAARRALESVAPLSLTARSSVGDVLNVREVGQGMEDWLIARPVEHQAFRNDLYVVVSLDASRPAVFEQFKALAEKQTEVPLPRNDREWADAKEQFVRRMAAPVGRAPAPGTEPVGVGIGIGREREPGMGIGMGFAPRKPLGLGGHRGGNDDGLGLIPRRAPAWASRQIEAEAKAESNRGRLHAARNAEAEADRKLRAQIEALPLSREMTIGQAAKQDQRVARAVDMAMARARIGQTKYHEDGSATVQLYLDLEQVWDALERAR